MQDGAKGVPVGKLIALLAEEGDDISNLEIPKEDAAAPPTEKQTTPQTSTPPPPAPTSTAETSATQPAVAHTLPPHSKPLFPSVHRLILEHGIQNIDQIKGTGVRGMLTKGDILAFLGKASGPNGTFKPAPSPIEEARKNLAPSKQEAKEVKPLDGAALRRLIVTSMLESSVKARNPAPGEYPLILQHEYRILRCLLQITRTQISTQFLKTISRLPRNRRHLQV